jgi:hypothetical protein
MATVQVINPKIAEFGASITNHPQDAFGPENPYLSTKAAALSPPQLTITHPHDLVAADDDKREHLSIAKADPHPPQCDPLKPLPDGNYIVGLIKITESHPKLSSVTTFCSPKCPCCQGKGKLPDLCNSLPLRLQSFQFGESQDSEPATLRQQVKDDKIDPDIAKTTVSDESLPSDLQPSSSSGDKEDRPSCPSSCSSPGHASEFEQSSSEVEIVGTEGIKERAPNASKGPSKGNKSRKRMNTSPEPSNKRHCANTWENQTRWHCVSFLGLFSRHFNPVEPRRNGMERD